MSRFFALFVILAALSAFSCLDSFEPSNSLLPEQNNSEALMIPAAERLLAMQWGEPLEMDFMIEDAKDQQAHVCEDPDAAGSECAVEMRYLYCDHQLPIIYQDREYSQTEATAECMAGHAPFYPDIIECHESLVHFVECLADRGWGPEATETFSVKDWWMLDAFTQGITVSKIQALNFFTYTQFLTDGYGCGGSLIVGAVVYRFPKMIRLLEGAQLSSMRYGWQYYGMGKSFRFEDEFIRVKLSGWYAYMDIYGYSGDGRLPNLIIFQHL